MNNSYDMIMTATLKQLFKIYSSQKINHRKYTGL